MVAGTMDAHESAVPEQLLAEVLELIEEGPDGSPARFDDLAPRVFEHQYSANLPYREFCDAAGVTPASVTRWQDIPAYPTDAFKREVVASFPVSDAVQALLTSGTTSPNQRGRIFRDEAGQKLVFTANRVMTRSYLFPDFSAEQRCRVLLLVPSPETAPSMGMAIGLDQTRRHFGTPDSTFLITRSGLDVNGLVAALRESEATGVPVALVGATSAFVYFFNACRKKRMRFQLPAGSRVCDGGGYRGRFGVVTREDYYTLAGDIFGVGVSHCVGTLGMAESATNYFDDVLRSAWLGRCTDRHKPAPPWTRVQAVSPETGEVLPHGEVGLLRHYDLANMPTVLGVQTDNLGFTDERGGFEIIGRARVVDGKVSELPSERTVGPMGDKRVFRLLEAYVNFSIDFKMGRLSSADEPADYLELRRDDDARAGEGSTDPVASCPIAVEDVVAGTDDPEARKRGEAALEEFRKSSPGKGPSR